MNLRINVTFFLPQNRLSGISRLRVFGNPSHPKSSVWQQAYMNAQQATAARCGILFFCGRLSTCSVSRTTFLESNWNTVFWHLLNRMVVLFIFHQIDKSFIGNGHRSPQASQERDFRLAVHSPHFPKSRGVEPGLPSTSPVSTGGGLFQN